MFSYTRRFRWDQVQSHIQYVEGLPNTVYEEIRKYLTIYEGAVSHI